MATLVTLDQAKQQIRVTWDDEDTSIQLLLDAAEASVLDYIKQDYGWTALTCPPFVKLAILVVLSTYYDPYRDGDDFDNDKIAYGYLPPAATALLHRLKKPALA